MLVYQHAMGRTRIWQPEINKDICVFKMGLETYTEIYLSVTFNLVGKNSEGLTVFILEFDDFMVKQPKTTGYEFFILHDIDNIDN